MDLEAMFGNEPDKGALLIDLSQIALATAAFAVEPGEKFTIPLVRHMILSTLRKNALRFKSEGFDHVIITVDNAKFGYWRRQEEDYYKRNRAIARAEAEEKESFDWEGYFEGLKVVIQELKDFMPYIVIDVKFCEADDCIAVLSKYLSGLGWKVRIISSDGDFTQLHEIENVDQYSPMQKKFVKVKMGSPAEDCMAKIVKGDKKDCVASTRVRGDFFLTVDTENERTPPTSELFIKSLVGKSDEEVRQLYYEDAVKKLKPKKDGLQKGHKYLELLGVEVYDRDASGNKTDIILEGHDDREVLANMLADLQLHRFQRNRVLIDFNYIRDDIRESILEEYKSYTPAPRGKMYSYFVKSGLTKLLPYISSF